MDGIAKCGYKSRIDAFRVHLDPPHELRLTGELDLFAAEELAKVLLPMCDIPATEVVVDLSGLTFVDSTGIALLLRAHRRAAAAKGRLLVRNAVGAVERVLRATGADEVLRPGLP